MGYIIWKGVKSTEIKGLLICQLPPITKPQMRVSETYIDGCDGSIIEELGYEPYDKTVSIALRGDFDIDEVIKYFTGEGEIVFSNEPDKVYRARIHAQIDYNRLLRFRQANVLFRVQPFKYAFNEGISTTQTAMASGRSIVLTDSGNTPMIISTDAESVLIHGKNLLDANAFELWSNATHEVFEDGYKIVATGGTNKTYTHARLGLPLGMKGKSYTLICDELEIIPSNASCGVQVIIKTSGGMVYHGIFYKAKSVDFVVPEDATEIELGIYTNNTNEPLTANNTLIVKGLRIVPTEFKAEPWCKFEYLREVETIDGQALLMGLEPTTILTDEENISMTATYFKPFEVVNKGLETSRPKMTITGNGTIAISVNDVGVFEYTFPEGENQVVIDSEKEDAYLGNALKNRNMNGEFPILQSGKNKIEWTGDVESIDVEVRSRWL